MKFKSVLLAGICSVAVNLTGTASCQRRSKNLPNGGV